MPITAVQKGHALTDATTRLSAPETVQELLVVREEIRQLAALRARRGPA